MAKKSVKLFRLILVCVSISGEHHGLLLISVIDSECKHELEGPYLSTTPLVKPSSSK